MNKFGKVSSDDHSMSLAESEKKGDLYSEIECIVVNSYTSPVNRHTHTHTQE